MTSAVREADVPSHNEMKERTNMSMRRPSIFVIPRQTVFDEQICIERW